MQFFRRHVRRINYVVVTCALAVIFLIFFQQYFTVYTALTLGYLFTSTRKHQSPMSYKSNIKKSIKLSKNIKLKLAQQKT